MSTYILGGAESRKPEGGGGNPTPSAAPAVSRASPPRRACLPKRTPWRTPPRRPPEGRRPGSSRPGAAGRSPCAVAPTRTRRRRPRETFRVPRFYRRLAVLRDSLKHRHCPRLLLARAKKELSRPTLNVHRGAPPDTAHPAPDDPRPRTTEFGRRRLRVSVGARWRRAGSGVPGPWRTVRSGRAEPSPPCARSGSVKTARSKWDGAGERRSRSEARDAVGRSSPSRTPAPTARLIDDLRPDQAHSSRTHFGVSPDPPASKGEGFRSGPQLAAGRKD